MAVSDANTESKDEAWKRITFTRELVEKILDGKVRCTYRKTPKLGKFLVLDSRFKRARAEDYRIYPINS